MFNHSVFGVLFSFSQHRLHYCVTPGYANDSNTKYNYRYRIRMASTNIRMSVVGSAAVLLVCLLVLSPVDGFGGIHGRVTGSPGKGPRPVLLRMSDEPTDPAAGGGGTATRYEVERTDEEWREYLTPDQYYILRKEGTETPGASPLNKISVEKNGPADAGTFTCAGCDAPLFLSETKYESGTGWPSFYQPVSASIVGLRTDYKMVVPRTECFCSKCGGHLGHVFEGTSFFFQNPTRKRGATKTTAQDPKHP